MSKKRDSKSKEQRPRNSTKPWERMPLEKVYPHRKSNQTRRGSTYWGRVLTCPMEHYIGNQWGLRRSYTGDALCLGSVMHWAFEELMTSMRDAQEIHPAYSHPSKLAPIEDEEFFGVGVKDGLDRGAAVIAQLLDVPGYEEISWQLVRMWGGVREWATQNNWQVAEIEQLKEAKDLSYEVSTRTDATVLLHEGPVVTRWIVEVKTGWDALERSLRMYSQGFQLKSQVLIERNQGNTPDGVLLFYVSKKNFDVSVVPIRYTDEELLEVHRLLEYGTKSKEKWSEEKSWPKVFQHCHRKYGACDFIGVCSEHSEQEIVRLRQADVTPQYYEK